MGDREGSKMLRSAREVGEDFFFFGGGGKGGGVREPVCRTGGEGGWVERPEVLHFVTMGDVTLV